MQTHSLDEFRSFAMDFALALAPRSSGATVVTLSGELGAGKTTFVQEIAKSLGVTESITSPTFVIEKVYEVEGSAFRRLVHIDAYRLKSEHELEVLGWKEIISEKRNLVLIEWPERVPGLMPERAVRLHFDIAGEGRIITIDGDQEG